MTITDILLLLLFALFSASLGRLYMYLIQPHQLFGFVQKWLLSTKSKVLYKSIGGCEVCTTQRFAELYFILYIVLTDLNFWLYILLFIGYGSLVFNLGTMKQKVNPIVKSKPLEL